MAPRRLALVLAVAVLAPLAPAAAAPDAWSVDFDLDTDRDGIVEDADDDSGEDSWSSARGAYFMVNVDDDDRNGRPDGIAIDEFSGAPTSEDSDVDGAADALDLTPLVVRIPPEAAAAGVGRVTLSDPTPGDLDVRAIHLFPAIASGVASAWGGPGETLAEVDLTAAIAVPGVTTLGIEGLFFRWTLAGAYGGTFPAGFDGVVDLRLTVELDDGSRLVDDVAIKVAPFLVLPNTQPARATFEITSGQLVPGSVGTGGSNQWTQDHAEIGFTQAPGRPAQHVVFRLPYLRTGGYTLPTWPIARALGPDVGVFLLRNSFGALSGDYGGNLEIVPPTPDHPLGRVLVGNTMSDALYAFLVDQEAQSPFPKATLDTSWLRVGHADEVFGFLPDPAGGFVVARASPSRGLALLDALPEDALFFATGRTSQGAHLVASGGASRKLLDAGVDFRAPAYSYARYLRIYDGTGAGQVAAISSRGDGELTISRSWLTGTHVALGPALAPGGAADCRVPCTGGGAIVQSSSSWIVTPDATSRFVLFEGTREWLATVVERSVVPVPEAFAEAPAAITAKEVREDAPFRALNERAEARIASAVANVTAALAPDSVRFADVPDLFMELTASPASKAVAFTPGAVNLQPVGGVTYLPAGFGPHDAGGRDVYEDEIADALPGSLALVDDWDLYHRLQGEVHCGTNVLRDPFARGW